MWYSAMRLYPQEHFFFLSFQNCTNSHSLSWIGAFAYSNTVYTHIHTLCQGIVGDLINSHYSCGMFNVSAGLIPPRVRLLLGCLVKNCREYRFSKLKHPFFSILIYSILFYCTWWPWEVTKEIKEERNSTQRFLNLNGSKLTIEYDFHME